MSAVPAVAQDAAPDDALERWDSLLDVPADTPVLWKAQIREASGAAAANALVSAYVVSDDPTGAMVPVPVARGRTDARDSVVLRAANSGALRDSALAGGGLARITVFIASPTGVTVRVHSVAFVGQSASGPAFWSADLAAISGDPALAQAQPDAIAGSTDPGIVPAGTITVGPLSEKVTLGAVPAGVTAAAPAAAAAPPGLCYQVSSLSPSVQRVKVGEFLLYELWTSTFTYRKTNSTSVQVPFGISIGGQNIQVGIAGALTLKSTNQQALMTAGRSTPDDGSLSLGFYAPFQARTYVWNCLGYPGQTTTAHTRGIVGYYYSLTAETRTLGSFPSCTKDANDTVLVSPTSSKYRGIGSYWSGSSPAATATFGLPGGSVSVGFNQTWQQGSYVDQYWVNNAAVNQRLCGVSGNPLYDNTRVVAKAA